jgi:hypothetical protein
MIVRLSKIGGQALITYVFMALAALGWGLIVVPPIIGDFYASRYHDFVAAPQPATITLVFGVFPSVMLITSVLLPIWLLHKDKRVSALITPVVSLVIWSICCSLYRIALNG